MISTPATLKCPTTFQALPDWDMLRFVPADTDVLLIGEWHLDLFQRRYLQDNLYALNEKGFRIMTVEIPPEQQNEAENEYVLFDQDAHRLTNHYLSDDKTPNPFRNQCTQLSQHNVLSQAKKIGMLTKWTDESHNSLSRSDRNGMTRRNLKMAQGIVDEARYGKVIHWVGHAHLYGGTEDNVAENSIQEYLHVEGLKTHTIGMVCDRGNLLNGNYARIASNDSNAFDTLRGDFMTNFAAEQNIKPIRLDLHQSCEKAGETMPDELIVFSQQGYQWCSTFISGRGNDREIDAEAAIWNAIPANKINRGRIAPVV